jgi:hypothetical protein
MAQRTQRAKKHTARLKAAARARRMLNLKRKGEKLIAMNYCGHWQVQIYRLKNLPMPLD